MTPDGQENPSGKETKVEESEMAGDTNITAKPLPPEPDPGVCFTPAADPRGNESSLIATGRFAGWKVVNPGKDYRWIKCQGCGGEVGVPQD
jgi:hypothetical protein